MKERENAFPIDKKIASLIGRAIADFSMIRAGDRILVGLSGGKDSMMLAYALARLRQLRLHTPDRFELAAVAVDPTDGRADFSSAARAAEALGIPFSVARHPIFEILKRSGTRSPCSLCANIRRGILATAAAEKHCGALALGHHLDDVAETAFLNLLYAGRFACFEPHMRMSRSGVRVIRPLIYVPEEAIARNASRLGFEILDLGCEYAPSSRRAALKEAIANLSGGAPDLRGNILHALKNNHAPDGWTHPGPE